MSSIAVLPIRFDAKVRLVADDVRERAERELTAAFERETDIRVVNAREVLKNVPLVAQLEPQQVGRRLKTDGVLVTTVHQFTERDGSAYGADRPATVDFSMKLLQSDGGGEVWRATYHYRDEPLADNLLNLGARVEAGAVGRFQSAQELLAVGFSSAGRDLAEVRQGTFQR